MFQAFQTWIIFPGQASQGQRSAIVRSNGDTELLGLSDGDGEHVAALFGPALRPDGSPDPGSAVRPTILYFYGNAMCLADCLSEMRQFRRLGCNVLVAEYLGYGMSGGRASEQGCYATADAAYEHLMSRRDIDPKRIIPAGWSLGAAVAIDLASRRPAQAVLAFSAFTNMADLGRRLLPFLPASLLLDQRFDSDRKVAKISVPTFFAHGRWDSIVPHDMSASLAKLARGKVTHLTFQADHNDLFDLGGEELWRAVKRFIDEL